MFRTAIATLVGSLVQSVDINTDPNYANFDLDQAYTTHLTKYGLSYGTV